MPDEALGCRPSITVGAAGPPNPLLRPHLPVAEGGGVHPLPVSHGLSSNSAATLGASPVGKPIGLPSNSAATLAASPVGKPIGLPSNSAATLAASPVGKPIGLPSLASLMSCESSRDVYPQRVKVSQNVPIFFSLHSYGFVIPDGLVSLFLFEFILCSVQLNWILQCFDAFHWASEKACFL